MTKLLVTGGSGFIGCNFIEYMLKTYPNYEVINLDLLTYAGCLENNGAVQDYPQYRFIHGDIRDRAFIFELFEKEQFDWVVNFAAESHVDRSIEDPSSFLTTNVLGTQVLVMWILTMHFDDECIRNSSVNGCLSMLWGEEIPSSINRRGVWRFIIRG